MLGLIHKKGLQVCYDTNINKNHSLSLQMLHTIYFTDPWDRGMGWTVRYSCVSERDRWTFRGTRSHGTVGWDGQ